MRNLLLTIPVLLCLQACVDKNIETAVRAELKDPGSAKFEKGFYNDTYGCVTVNAKNSFGGYTGAQVAHLARTGEETWNVIHISSSLQCSQEEMDRLQSQDLAEVEFVKKILATMKQKKLIPESAISIVDIQDTACGSLAIKMKVEFGMSQIENGRVSANSKSLAYNWKMLNAGFCE